MIGLWELFVATLSPLRTTEKSVSAVFLPFNRLNKACNKDFETDEDEDGAAENARLARELGADLFADDDTAHADHEGDCGDDERGDQRFRKVVFLDGKADGECVDRGCHALNNESDEGDCAAFLVTFGAFDSFDEHLRADVAEKRECDPRDKLLECLKILYDRADAYPSDHRHERLKECEHTGDTGHFSELHFRLVQSVCQRNGKSVHGESHAEHNAEKEKFPSEIH